VLHTLEHGAPPPPSLGFMQLRFRPRLSPAHFSATSSQNRASISRLISTALPLFLSPFAIALATTPTCRFSRQRVAVYTFADGVGGPLARELSKLFSASVAGDGRSSEAGRQQLYALCLGSIVGTSEVAKSEALHGGKDSSLIGVALGCLFDAVAQLSVLDLATHLKVFF